MCDTEPKTVAEFELKIHREIECPNWLKINHPELFESLETTDADAEGVLPQS